MNRQPFEGSRLRLQWAKESLADFERCAKIYFWRTPRDVFIEPDPDGIHERHKFRFDQSPPPSLTKFAVYVVEDLRSALDLAAFDIAVLKRLPLDGVYFPFCKSSTDLKSRINSACKDFPQEIKDLFASYEPYAGGSDLLAAINELCNASKHRIIVPVASIVGTNLPYIETTAPMTRPIQILDGYDSAENEITFAITQHGLQWKYQAQFSFHICFGKVGAIEGREVGPNLEGMIRVVTTIVNETEAESRRLGLIP